MLKVLIFFFDACFSKKKFIEDISYVESVHLVKSSKTIFQRRNSWHILEHIGYVYDEKE
jgi:hypothetical protein